ncbi:potassium channel subfamily T member 2-like isoform X3 [Mercenaria mercenaria]|uniref:potassium channel subfamily T member 2-like isoform X3 n=1 Tax=Mercenaria mercenaria TaxID=6596 RepID=UPI00234F4E4A|nr:potassium channel subfamily T member 2-like isoform X3 [Mercenaria mercenaria]XP_053380952.1 potassium channel subfamily T member 2-like isoform X3 [Mercenaria mercenaria]
MGSKRQSGGYDPIPNVPDIQVEQEDGPEKRPGRSTMHTLSSDVTDISDNESININRDTGVRVEFFTNEKSFKERLQLYFIKNQRSSLRIRIFNLVIKLLTCVLYTVRVLTENIPPDCDSLPDTVSTNNGSDVVEEVNCWKSIDKEMFQEHPTIHWDHIIWVDRHNVLLFVQVTVAVISLSETILVQYLSYKYFSSKGNILQQILSVEFILELFLTVPFIITIFWAPLRRLFIPVFLNCWLAKQSMQNMFNDLHRVMQKSQSALAQQLMILCATLICLVFISACGIQHLQRGGNRQLDLFEAMYFTIVTLSTVGYGDIHPDIWPSRLWMLCMIVAALLVLPTQLEQLAYTWMERQKQGGTYSSHRAQTEKHVVVCTTTLQADTIMDFLNEFYSHPKLQDYFVVLLSPCELDPTMKVLLQVPMWAQRVIFIQGSALKDTDLARCRVQDAEACFILSTQNVENKEAADQHTIMRSWAIKDFAPECPQYVQIFRPENKFHVKFAEHVVCVDEFKYALLANNCLCPATSTLVTLLLHTSRGQEGQSSSEEWQRLYGKCSGNEIYHIRLGESKFFGEYKGKSFTYASFHAHRKYGVSLVGVQQNSGVSTIQLNPGPRHIMKESDICFYMNISKEENSAFILAHPNQEESKLDRKLMQGGEHTSKVASVIASVGTMALELQHTRLINAPPEIKRTGSRRTKLELPAGLTAANLQKRPSIAPVPAFVEASDITIQIEEETMSEDSLPYVDEEDNPEYVRGFPPVTPYIGTSPTLCHLMREKRPLCCLQLVQLCEHCSFNNAKEYHWPNPTIIVAADYASNGLYNFIVPLRSHARPSNTLNPIVLVLEKRPDTTFLETICHFPMVYWMLGSIDAIDDLLRAGINLADNVVIVNKESSNSQEEETLADCNTIVAVQSIFRLFPSANIITELTQSSNMRFMQFQANDSYSYELSKQEKKEKERGSHISYMFRLPFAAGNVFSASMLDTLLYQAFVKDYLITFVRLLLGIDQAVGSGHLSCMKITKDDLWIRTYGRLYQKLCSTTCEIPIGIYRTQTKSCRSPPVNTSNASFMSRDQSALNLAFRNSVRGRTYRNQNGVSLNMMTGGDRHDDHSGQVNPELHEISQMVKCRMQSIGQPLDDYDEKNEKKDTISYVVINPGYDLQLKLGDVVYLIRPSSLSPKPSPLIDERKQMQHHMNGKREEPTGADNAEIQAADTVVKTKGRIVKDGNNRIPIIYMDDSETEDEMTENDKTTSENTERNKNIPTFDLMTDDDEQEDVSKHISRSDSLEPPVIAVKGTVV